MKPKITVDKESGAIYIKLKESKPCLVHTKEVRSKPFVLFDYMENEIVGIEIIP